MPSGNHCLYLFVFAFFFVCVCVGLGGGANAPFRSYLLVPAVEGSFDLSDAATGALHKPPQYMPPLSCVQEFLHLALCSQYVVFHPGQVRVVGYIRR